MAVRAFCVATRLLLAVGGGYVATSGLVALAAVTLPIGGFMPRSEAVVLAMMLAFLIYLAILIWAFTEPRLCVLSSGLTLLAVAGFGLAGLIGPAN